MKQLIDAIEDGDVIPVIGRGACVLDDTGTTFDNWLATKVCERLNLEPRNFADSGHHLGVNRLVSGALIQGGKASAVEVTREIRRVINTEQMPTSSSLTRLAEIGQFPVFLSTCFDPMLEQELNRVRYGAAQSHKVSSVEFSPTSNRAQLDLPASMDDLRAEDASCLYYLFGKCSKRPENYAKWDEDAIHFALEFHRFLSESDSSIISAELKEKDLLLIGLNFTDWLTRFFLAIARQERLSRSGSAFSQTIADTHIEDSLVVFFDSVGRQTTVTHAGDPAEFIAELHEACVARFGPSQFNPAPEVVGYKPSLPIIREGDVFLSYARDDLFQAMQIKTDLETAGCRVWMDMERLQAGMNWENTLYTEVAERCSVFVSLISKASEKPRYCQVERNWANERAKRFGRRPEDFYVPVRIEEVPMRFEPVPASIQVVDLSSGQPDTKFAGRIRELQSRNQTHLST